MIKKIQILLMFCASITGIKAQDGGTSSNVAKTIDMFPKSPEAAALSQYVDIPAGNFTGVADFSIPIYTIDFDGQQIPISLRYTTTGIKVDQIATRVGLGWALDAGPSLSQQVIGELDFNEKPNFGPYFSPNGMTNQQDPVYQFALNAAGIGSQHFELEPDIFTYSLLKKNGKYIINRQGTKGIPIPYNQLDITPSNSRTQMNIIDEQGYKYVFNSYPDYEIWNKNTCTSLGEFTFNGPNFKIQKITSPKNESVNFLYTPFVAHSKYITSVMTQVAYAYNPGLGVIPIYPPTGPTANTKCVNYAESKEAALDEIQFKGGKIKFIYSNKDSELRLDLPGDIYLKQVKVINDKGETIRDFSLNYDYFQSNEQPPTTSTIGFMYLGDYLGGLNYRLKLINVVDNLTASKYVLEYNESAALPVRTSNNQDFWGVYNGANNGIRAVSSDPSDVGYYSGGTKFLGANKNPNISYGILGNLKKITYPSGGYTTIDYEADEYDSSGDPPVVTTNDIPIDPIYGSDPATEFILPQDVVNKAIDFYSPYSGTTNSGTCSWELRNEAGVKIDGGAKTITIPRNDPPGKYFLKLSEPIGGGMKGSCGVNYSYSIREIISVDTLYSKNAGTIRVAKIESFDLNNGKITREFTYKIPKPNYTLPYDRSSGIIHGDIYFSNRSARYSPSPSETPGQTATEIYLVNNPGWQTSNLNGKSIGYTYVQEYYKDENHPENSYRKEYEFNNTTEYDITYGEDNGTSVTWSPGNMENGLLKKEILFTSNNQKVKETYKSYKFDSYFNYKYGNNTYNQIGMEMGYGLKIYPKAKRGQMYDFNYSIYQLKNKWIREDSTVVRDYDKNGIDYLETIKINNYSIPSYKHTYPTESYSSGSKGENLKTIFRYPQDIAMGEDQYSTMQALISKNRLSDPVITKSYTDNLVTSEVRTLYDQFNTGNDALILPKYIYLKKGENATVADRKITYDSYDTAGNLTQYTLEGGTPVSIIWGYNKTKPIAKIQGALYDNIKNNTLITDAVTAAENDNMSIVGTTAEQTEQALVVALENLRTGANFASYQITTYSYDPLVGVRSVTPPSGIREYYMYDDAKRLQSIYIKEKNAMGNEVVKILKEYKYNYKP